MGYYLDTYTDMLFTGTRILEKIARPVWRLIGADFHYTDTINFELFWSQIKLETN